jgi:predicted NACHT family NTPase
MPIDPATLAAGSTAAAWLWDKYGKEFIDKLGGKAKGRWAKFNWRKASESYRQKMAELYGTTRILGKSGPVELEGIFTDVFILDKPTALRRYDLEELKESFARQGRHLKLDETRHDALDLVSQPENRRLYILGKPGAGKTTFLRYVALQAVKGNIDLVPIFVSLKEWSDSGLELMAFIVKQFEICSFPEAEPFIGQLLEAGRAIVLFDGLDEVNQESGQRSQVIDALSNFSKQYHTCQCLITCRIAATDYIFEHFTYVEMADFDDEQMRIYVKKWFPDEEMQDSFFAGFFSAESEGLQELGRIPLLLSLLCLNFEETLTFPQKRVEIYEEAIDALLKKWDSSRKIKRDEVYRKLSLNRKRQMFARIAAETFEAGDYFLRQRDLEQRIVAYLQNLPPVDAEEDVDGEVVLKAIEAQHSIVVERARKIYSFAHLTFQEYFTAKFLAERESRVALLMRHLKDDRWREVFILTASLLDDADEFFDLFQRDIDNLIAKDEALVELLSWAERRAAAYNASYRSAALRSVYIYFARTLEGELAYAHAHALPLEPAVVRARVHAVNLAIALDPTFGALALDPILDPIRVLAFDSTLDSDLKLDLNLGLALYLAQVFSLIEDTDHIRSDVTRFADHFAGIIQLSQEASEADLAEILGELQIPPEGSSVATW